MADHTLTYVATTGGTYYAYPLGQSLADWTTYRVAFTESGSPNTGLYQTTVDDGNGVIWYIFSGASQPSSWDTNVASIDLTNHAAKIRDWYVDDSATGAGTGFNWTDAFTDLADAFTQAEDGDTIYVAQGTYSGAFSINNNSITVIGQSPTYTVISHNDGYTLSCNGENITLRGLAISALAETNNGTAVLANADNLTLIDCIVIGKYAGIRNINTIRNLQALGCNITGTYYAMRLYDVICGNFERTRFHSYASHTTDNEFASVFIDSSETDPLLNPVINTFRSCQLSVLRTGTSATNKNTVGLIASGSTLLENCRVTATATNGSYGGSTIGFLGDAPVGATPTFAGTTTIIGGSITQDNSGSGTDFDLKTGLAASTVTVVGTDYATSSMTGTLNDDSVALAALPATLLNTDKDDYTTSDTLGEALRNLAVIFTSPAAGDGEISTTALAQVLTPLAVVDGNVDDIETLLGTVNTTVNTIDGNVLALPSASDVNTAVEGGQVGTDAGNAAGFAFLASNSAADLQTRMQNGSTLTVQAGSTVSSLIVTAETGIDATHLDNASIVTSTVGRVRGLVRVDGVSGSAPNFTLTLTPDLPDTPQTGDKFIVGPQYLDTGSL